VTESVFEQGETAIPIVKFSTGPLVPAIERVGSLIENHHSVQMEIGELRIANLVQTGVESRTEKETKRDREGAKRRGSKCREKG
jgi:hypothetical protein